MPNRWDTQVCVVTWAWPLVSCLPGVCYGFMWKVVNREITLFCIFDIIYNINDISHKTSSVTFEFGLK